MSEQTRPKWNYIVSFVTGEKATFPSDHDTLVASELLLDAYVFTDSHGEEHHVRTTAIVEIQRFKYSRVGGMLTA